MEHLAHFQTNTSICHTYTHTDADTGRGYIDSNLVIYTGHLAFIVLSLHGVYESYDRLRAMTWKWDREWKVGHTVLELGLLCITELSIPCSMCSEL